MSELILFAMIGVLVGYYAGWANAHLTVATECERLGKFFVGKKVYECTLIRDVEGSKDDE